MKHPPLHVLPSARLIAVFLPCCSAPAPPPQVAVMHGDLPVVQRLVAEVAGVSADMLEQLLQRLQGAIQLPECLRIIGYLRRLAAFPGGWVQSCCLWPRA